MDDCRLPSVVLVAPKHVIGGVALKKTPLRISYMMDKEQEEPKHKCRVDRPTNALDSAT